MAKNKVAEEALKPTVIPKSCMFMPRNACAGASSILLRFLGCAGALVCGVGVVVSLTGSGVAVSFPGSSFTEGDFSMEAIGVTEVVAGA